MSLYKLLAIWIIYNLDSQVFKTPDRLFCQVILVMMTWQDFQNQNKATCYFYGAFRLDEITKCFHQFRIGRRLRFLYKGSCTKKEKKGWNTVISTLI